MSSQPPEVSRLHETVWLLKSDGPDICPWCGKAVFVGQLVVRHFVETPEGRAPVAVLHVVCSTEQREHEEDFGDR